jgi:hypothetical protein
LLDFVSLRAPGVFAAFFAAFPPSWRKDVDESEESFSLKIAQAGGICDASPGASESSTR